MRSLWIGLIVVVVLATAATTWWLSGDIELPTIGAETPSTKTPEQALFERPTDEEAFDAGVGALSGVVLDPDAAPVAGALVRLFPAALELEELSCGRCHENVLDCTDPATASKILSGLRSGQFKPPAPLAETRSDAQGRFTFEDVPLDATVVASAGTLQGEVSGLEEELEVMLSKPFVQSVQVTTDDESPLTSARVTLFSPRTGTLEEFAVSADGKVSLESADLHAWVVVEAPGYLPQGQRLEMASQFTLTKPKKLLIRTRVGGAPIDAEVSLSMHGDPQTFRTTRGELEIDQLPGGYYTVGVTAGDLGATDQSAELIEDVTTLEFELRKRARLLVTVITESGEPVELSDGSLSSPDAYVSASAENGAMLELGPVPEGEYQLNVGSEEMVPFAKTLDLKPGDTTLEVTLRKAPKLTGVVKNAQGKPVARARIGAWEGGQEHATTLSDDEGNFELVLRFEGPHTLKVEEQRTGNAELDVNVPGPPVTVTLRERGVLEVEVFDFDGTAMMANVSLRSETSNQTRWADQEEAGPVRIAGLSPGTWTVERTQPGRLPVSRKVEVSEGQVAKVRITLDRGATITGRVVDHEGKPLAAMLVLVGRPEIVNANEDGTFEWSGAEPGERELFAVMPNQGESPHVKVTAPARDVVLKMPKPLQVSGRVVDDRGQPVTEFDVNGLQVKSSDGRFRVASPEKTLDVYVDGFAPVYLTEVEADVGDVVMKKFPVTEGEVVDPDGKPVAGAQVSTRMDLMPVTTDAAGRFKLVVTQEEIEDGIEFVAVRGMLSGTTRGKPGAFTRIVMRRGSVVRGRVVDAKGAGVSTAVTAMSAISQSPMETESDASGRFQFELAPGVWRFSTRFNRVQRSIEIGSEAIEITLGEESGSCGLVVQSSRAIESVWLFSNSAGAVEDPWDAVQFTAGSIEVPVIVPGNSVSARGLPCGRFSLVASLGGEMASQEVNLRGPGEQVSIEPTPETSPIKEPLDVTVEVP